MIDTPGLRLPCLSTDTACKVNHAIRVNLKLAQYVWSSKIFISWQQQPKPQHTHGSNLAMSIPRPRPKSLEPNAARRHFYGCCRLPPFAGLFDQRPDQAKGQKNLPALRTSSRPRTKRPCETRKPLPHLSYEASKKDCDWDLNKGL